ncbi:MAG: rhodanese-like domain-containing protein, partial [Acidimicrobiia bacterium]
VNRLIERGAEVIDVRPILDFAAGHIPGSLSIELRDEFATWLGWLIDPDRSVVFVADPSQDLAAAIRQCLNIGYERLGGYLAGGIPAWQQSGRPLTTVRVLSADEIPPQLAMIDVRQESEWDTGHVPGAIHVELGEIVDRSSELPGELVLHCGHGQRSMTAASVLQRSGRVDVAVTTASAGELTRAGPSPTR